MAGTCYEQVRNGLLAGFDQMGGYLAAYDAESGRELWTLKVNDNKRNPEKEGDVQDVFFKSMTTQPDGTLLIENERTGLRTRGSQKRPPQPFDQFGPTFTHL